MNNGYWIMCVWCFFWVGIMSCYASAPPSAFSMEPVMKVDWSEQSQRAMSATSCGVPIRFIAWKLMACCRASGLCASFFLPSMIWFNKTGVMFSKTPIENKLTFYEKTFSLILLIMYIKWFVLSYSADNSAEIWWCKITFDILSGLSN